MKRKIIKLITFVIQILIFIVGSIFAYNYYLPYDLSKNQKENLILLGIYDEFLYKAIFNITVVWSLTLGVCVCLAYIIKLFSKEKYKG